jgi:hypothetical protein
LSTNIDNTISSPSIPQPSSSQGTESTITLSSPSQDLEAEEEVHSQMKASVECQTNEGVFLSKEEYEKLTEKPDIKGDLEKLKIFLLSYDPQ